MQRWGLHMTLFRCHKIPGVETLGAATFARTGRAQEAQKLADDVNRDHPLDDAIQNNWLPSISAAANLGSDPQAGIRRLELAYPYELGDVSFGTESFGRMYPVYMRGLCLPEVQDKVSRQRANSRKFSIIVV